MKVLPLIAACALLGVTTANAATFNIIGAGVLTGTIDVTGGAITSANLNLAGETLSNTPPFFSAASGSDWELKVQNITINDGVDIIFSPSFDATHTNNLTGFIGGTIVSWTEYLPLGCSDEEFGCPVSSGTTGTIAAATPLPAALPLFATGIGGLGLLGWRRKRKARAV